jgi:hypothetical protein
MTRNTLLLCLLLNSCSGIPAEFYQELYFNMKSMVVSSELDSSKNFYDDFKYSFASMSIGNSGQSIVVLSSINNNIYEWVSEDGVLIYTRKGKIIQTIGLQHDSSLNAVTPDWVDGFSSNFQLDLYNPDALSLMGKQLIIYNGPSITNHLQETIEVFEYTETISVEAIKWRAENKYLLNNDGLVIKSTQKIHPYLADIEIQYFFK